MEEPNNDIDTDTLQAQIDLSMAYAQNLISSWLPTSGPMTQPSSRAAEAEAELQVLLRRPPRLGVGAPLPETPAPAQTRLVQKLEGGKRRARELENGTTANKDEQEEEKDSAEESRAAGIAIRKRQRADPFEAGGKKKNRKVVVGTAGTVETAQAKDGDVEMEEASQSGPMVANDAMTKPGSKKKKKKKHLLESQGAQEHVARGGPRGDARSARLEADIAPHAESSDHSSLLEEWAGISQDQQGSPGGTPNSYSVASSGIGAPPPRESPKLPSRSPLQPPTASVPSSTLPILNLTGAPPISCEEPSPIKKRRRKKKKKKPSTNQAQDDGPPDPCPFAPLSPSR